jgi:hypothetical protein
VVTAGKGTPIASRASARHETIMGLEVRTYLPGDEDAILATFNLVFREECGDAFVDRNLAQWRWEFLENPAGTQIFLAIADDGTVASQYAAVPQLADTDFGPVRFVHIVDSMTHPAYRQGLQKIGLFTTLGRRFTDDYRVHGNELGYGFPVKAAERIGSRYLDYSFLRVIDYLGRPVTLDAPSPPGAIRVERTPALPADVDDLWHRVRAERHCLVRRDHRYLHWRYVQNPDRRHYEIWSARRGDELAGLAILRPQHELVADSCTIADWLCPDAEDDAASALLAVACRRAGECGRAHLLAVSADTSPDWSWFRRNGFVAWPSTQWLERRLTYRITGPYLDEDYLRSRWSYSLGDSDLV